jgi:nitrous oxidase accessory protein NosD
MEYKGTTLTFLLLTVLLTTACSGVSQAEVKGATVVVSPGDSIQAKIDLAQPGDTILIQSGVYVETNYPIVINQTLTLVGESVEATIVDGADTEKGIFLVKSSGVQIRGLTIRNTVESSFVPVAGVQLFDVENVEVVDCRLEDTIVGVLLKTSNQSHIARNWINNNRIAGIYLREHSTSNIIQGNTILNNTNGIWVADLTCVGNTFYHNNFMNNVRHVMLLEEIGEWHNGYPSGGNYWSNYTGPDALNGPGQDQVGSDGIGDTPHQSGFDRYPYIHPIRFFNAGVWNNDDLWVAISSNATVGGFRFDPAAGPFLGFNLTAAAEEAGSCRVLVPLHLLWVENPAQWIVEANGTALNPLFLEDLESTFFHFAYEGRVLAIVIRGAYAVPELPSIIFLASALLLLGVAMMLIRELPQKHNSAEKRG